MAGKCSSIPYRRCALWHRASSDSKTSFFVRPHENDMSAFLKNSNIRKRCFRVDERLQWRKKSLFSKITVFVWTGPYVASEKNIPSPNGQKIEFFLKNPKKWSVVRKSFWMETLSRDAGFLLNFKQSLPNGSYTHCNKDFISDLVSIPYSISH